VTQRGSEFLIEGTQLLDLPRFVRVMEAEGRLKIDPIVHSHARGQDAYTYLAFARLRLALEKLIRQNDLPGWNPQWQLRAGETVAEIVPRVLRSRAAKK